MATVERTEEPINYIFCWSVSFLEKKTSPTPTPPKRTAILVSRAFIHKTCFLSNFRSEFARPISLRIFCTTMGSLERTVRILDALGLFIVTRFPFIELFLLLMATGDQAEKTPIGKIANFRDTLRKEYFLVYVNAFVFFVCGTGMTMDFKRRQCGFAAAIHELVYAVITLYQQKNRSEYLIVSKYSHI